MNDKEKTIKPEDLPTHVYYIRRDVAEIKKKLESNYVTQDQFKPVKAIVYGLVSLILTAVIVALLALVVRSV